MRKGLHPVTSPEEGEEEEGEEEEEEEEEEGEGERGASCAPSATEGELEEAVSAKEGEEKGKEDIFLSHKGNNEDKDPNVPSVLPANSLKKTSPTHFDFKG